MTRLRFRPTASGRGARSERMRGKPHGAHVWTGARRSAQSTSPPAEVGLPLQRRDASLSRGRRPDAPTTHPRRATGAERPPAARSPSRPQPREPPLPHPRSAGRLDASACRSRRPSRLRFHNESADALSPSLRWREARLQMGAGAAMGRARVGADDGHQEERNHVGPVLRDLRTSVRRARSRAHSLTTRRRSLRAAAPRGRAPRRPPPAALNRQRRRTLPPPAPVAQRPVPPPPAGSLGRRRRRAFFCTL